MSEDLTGRNLGHYRIDGVLGKGGMSVLYRATDTRLGRKVALKVIAEHITSDPEFRERFVDEARNTSAVDHSNVVPLYDFGEVDGLLYIAMRLVDGSDLASLIAAGPLEPSRAVVLLAQVADALDMLHGRGLVHLDVKPANVLVTTREAAGEHVYLADFGLTRRGATGHRTRGGDFLGSPTYAAPEHLRGEPVDARTDVYSLGCVFYACLVGQPPYEGSVPEVIQGHLGAAVPKPSASREPLAAFDEVIRSAVAKDPQQRYPHCRDMIVAARQAIRAAGEQHRTGGAGAAAAGAAGAAAAGAAAAAAAPAFGAPHGQQPPHNTPGQPPAPQQPGQYQQAPQQPAQQRPPQHQPPNHPPQQHPNQHPNQQQPWQQGAPGHPAPPGYPPAQPGYPPPGRNNPASDPVRLRPPVPARNEAFSEQQPGRKRWVVPVLLVALVLAAGLLVVVLVQGASSNDPGGGNRTNPPGGRLSSLPEVPVGPSGEQSRKPLPTSVPIRPR